MNCRNVRREIEETDAGEFLSVAAREHLASCTSCETLSREQISLQAIVSSLGTVEAPGDFDFRLRARLAGEKTGNGRYYALGSFSFGLRAAALATVLLLLGSAFVFVTFRTRPNGPDSAGGQQLAVIPGISVTAGANGEIKPVVEPSATDVADVGPKATEPQGVKRRANGNSGNNGNSAVATARNNRNATLDSGFEQAPVLRPYDADEAFQIDASTQALRVSVNNSRGAARTISLPTVSFGSQKALSQSATPLMASARGVW